MDELTGRCDQCERTGRVVASHVEQQDQHNCLNVSHILQVEVELIGNGCGVRRIEAIAIDGPQVTDHQVQQLLVVDTVTAGVATFPAVARVDQVVVSDRGQKLFGALLQNLLDAPQNEEGSHVVVRAVAGGLYVDVAANRDG